MKKGKINMKKFLFGIIILVIVIGIACLSIKSSINHKIESKIEELNQNGFVISHKKDSKFGKTLGSGTAEIIYPNKVFSYLLSKIEDEDMKKSYESLFILLDDDQKEELLEGVTFEYDFVISNLSSNLDLNIYLTKLSQRTMYDVEKESYYAQRTNWLKDILENKKIHINMDKEKNFKLDDISFVIPNDSLFITLRGVNGTKDSLNISLLRISDTYSSNKFMLNNLDLKYDLQKDSQSSKAIISNIEFKDKKGFFNLKNLSIDSKTLQNKDNISGNSSISFDELNIKDKEDLYTQYTQQKPQSIELKKTALNIAIDKFPLQKYEDMMKALFSNLSDETNVQKESFDFIKMAAQNSFELTIGGQSDGLKVDEKSIFNSLKINSNFKLNKNLVLDENAPQPKGLPDIFEIIKANIDIDDEGYINLLGNFEILDNPEFKAIDIENNQKRLSLELKSDGLYINEKKLLENKELDFSFLKNINKNLQGVVTKSYELIDKNLLRITFKYKTNLKNLNGGGIFVSFPQFTDASKIKAHHTNSFDKINYYVAGQDIKASGKDIKASYLLIEAWDENWKDKNQEKEFSVDIDITDLKDDLQINLRGEAFKTNAGIGNEKVPDKVLDGFTTDQQFYPVQIEDIYLNDLVPTKLDSLSKNSKGKVESFHQLIDENLLRVTFKYNTGLEKIKQGGISVSFPQFKYASKIKASHTKTFDTINYYEANQELYSGYLGKNIQSKYLLVEGWDTNWNDKNEQKEFSVDIDISELKKNNQSLAINLRGGALDSSGASELVPNDENGEIDQQSYPVLIKDIHNLRNLEVSPKK